MGPQTEIDYEYTPEKAEQIVAIRKIIYSTNEEDFNKGGYSFTYNVVKLLLDRIAGLEMEAELQGILREGEADDQASAE